MSLLGTLGKIATVGASVFTGGTAGAVFGGAATILGGGGGSSSRTQQKASLLSQLTVDPRKPSIFASPLPTPDSVVITGSGTTIGPGGSIFATGEGKATAYFPGSGLAQDPFGGVQSGASSTAAVCAVGSGMRLNKTGYFLRSGQYIAPRTKCVKSRRRNPLNPRALSRAMSRLASAKKAAKALDRFEVKGRRCR